MIRFKRVYLEITNMCNLACAFCPPTRRKPEMMSVASFSVILDKLKPYTDFLYLHVKGEPLLHPDLELMLALCHAKGFQVNLTTNGTLIKERGSMLLKQPALRAVFFSLHSWAGNSGQDEGANEYLQPIIDFTKNAITQTNLIVSLRLWNLDATAKNREERRNHRLLEQIEQAFGITCRITEEVIPGKGVKLASNLFINYDHPFEWPTPATTKETIQGFCYALRNQIAVLADGTVVPCCLDGEGVVELGNLFETDLGAIITGNRAQKIIQGFAQRRAVEELCRKCRYKERFFSICDKG